MRIRITKKMNNAGIWYYYAYQLKGKVLQYWSYICLVGDYGKGDPIVNLKKEVESHFQDEIIVLEYDR